MAHKKGQRLFPFLFLLIFLSSLFTSYVEGEEISWLEDYKTALNKAEESDRLLVIAFYTSWCFYCKKLDRETFTDPRIIHLSKEFVFAKLDADMQKAATFKYRPEGYPTVIFSSPKGEEILRISGYHDADQFLAVLERVRDHGLQISQLLSRIEDHPRDFKAQESLGKLYRKMGLFEKAQWHLKKALKSIPSSSLTSDEGAESDEDRILFQLSQVALADKNYRKASKILEKLIKKKTSCDCLRNYYLELGKAYMSWGKGKKATKVLEKLVQLYPDSEEAQAAIELIYKNHS